jgi:hypothetical protein
MDAVYIRGARRIAKELQKLGIIAPDDPDPEGKVYHLSRTKQLPLDRFGRGLITTVKLRQLVNKQIA